MACEITGEITGEITSASACEISSNQLITPLKI